MANKNAKSLAGAIPECISGCFEIGVATTGCAKDDYDCWCYKHNHQTIVDTVEQCLGNKERRTKEKCTKDENFQYENSYWKICEQYWEPYGTATEPTSFPTAVSSTRSMTATLKTEATTTAPSKETLGIEESSGTTARVTATGESEQAQASGDADSVNVGNSGLSPGGKAGVGVGVAIGVMLIGIAVFLWLRERRRRRTVEEQLRIAEIEKANAAEGGYYAHKGLFEMEGDRPHAEELRGSMRTPELGVEETVKSDSTTQVEPPYQGKHRGQARELEAKLGRLERLLQNSQHAMASRIEDDQYRTLPSNTRDESVVKLGLFEEAPPQELIKTLMNIYFNKIHQAAPMLHRQRFMASLFLPGHMKPPMCLQYIVMAFAAETSDSYRHLGMAFYKRAIAYLQAYDEGPANYSVSLGHVQAWALTSCFEAERTMFSKASITLCSALKFAQMLGLHRVDSTQPNENHLVDWIEVEERRHTWWTIFCFDRFIRTRLPASDKAYTYGQEEHTRFLEDQLLEDELHSSFAGRVLTAHIFHRTIEHTCVDTSQHFEVENLNDSYWKRHKSIDNDLKYMLLMLPRTLHLPANYRNHNAVFVNVMLHTATICLHRAALWKMKANLQESTTYMIRLSQDRLIPAAEEILSIFKMIPDLGTTFTNPLICFAAYMSALVFLASTSPTEPNKENEENLDFILKIMVAFGTTNLVADALTNEIAKEMQQCGIKSAAMDKMLIKKIE
ncbi:hypothetical protein F53441_5269 [Fusarium austroafricanum]|uniref:Transcription factor domain-containing protein n=1 Tax=Fusarium austroafricanum TaxID=2364996 RepID=A0A8H4KM24_9HYPO|nr:hypothetical protein F53441_5269 [Fusarium austroafricanum]